MKLKFESLAYQKKAVKAIIDVFKDCKFKTSNDTKGNPVLQKDPKKLEENIKKIRKDNKTENYGLISTKESTLNLDVLMETGTGKTFTFIQTLYELNEKYGLAKFIILVPSNAIRFGAIKNLEITKEYFFSNYGKNLSIFNYSEKTIIGFINNNNKKINVLITSFASFNRDKNIIHQQKLEKSLLGNAKSYIEAIAKLNPVIIIDEPHRAKGEQTQKFIPKLNAQLILRFGATFKNDFNNLIYTLDSPTAFKENLVKSISVSSVGFVNNLQTQLKFQAKTKEGARINFEEGNEKKIEVVKLGTNLGKKFNKNELNSYIIETIKQKEITFTNGFKLTLGASQGFGELKQANQEKILKEAIDLHFEKEKCLFEKGIKALSLFFIDEVSNYLLDNNQPGWLAKTFEDSYKKKLDKILKGSLCEKYRNYLEASKNELKTVHNGYFARSIRDKDNDTAIELILRDKEKLLSFNTPLRFIFSKWALQEGWDNPNIFTLCKMAPSNSEISKLQQIGRGLRLPVNQDGERITKEDPNFETIAELNVVVSEDEQNFVEGIQNDIDSLSLKQKTSFNEKILIDAGIAEHKKEARDLILVLVKLKLITEDDDLNCKIIATMEQFEKVKSEIKNPQMIEYLENIYQLKQKIKQKDRSIKKAVINQENFEKFKEMWELINNKAVYKYNIDSEILVKNVSDEINKSLDLKPIKVKVTTTSHVEFVKDTSSTTKIEEAITSTPLTIGEFFKSLIDKTKLTPRTLTKILKTIDCKKYEMIQKNTRRAVPKIAAICIDKINQQLIQEISFEFVETNVSNQKTILTNNKGNALKSIDSALLGQKFLEVKILNKKVQAKSLYKDYLGYDSEIEKETIENSNDTKIEVFAKLPKINIPTPIGNYNPDFAFVINQNGDKKIYLIVETKGYDDEKNIHPSEAEKIEFGKAFFKDLAKKNSNICFRTKINKPALSELIAEVINDSNQKK